MRFWDTSALVATEIDEKATKTARKLVQDDSELVVWILTDVEVATALWRRCRNGEMTESERSEAQRRLDETLSNAVNVSDVFAVARRARRLLAAYTLRAADAMQLAA